MAKTDPTITIIDVAREASVSNSTVSRVVNNSERVKPETREKVLSAMARLGYVANQQARSLRGGRSRIVGLVVHEVGNPYIGEIIRGIDEELAANNYRLMLYTTRRHKTRESTFVAEILGGMADGLLVLLPRDLGSYVKKLKQQRFPFVLIDYPGDENGFSSVIATNWQGAYDATAYLIGLGHTRIGFITGLMEVSAAVKRLEGYKDALSNHNIEYDASLVYEGDFFQPDGFAGAEYLLDLPERPTAIFSSNDVSAFGAIDAIRNRGLRIPDDISVIGFDDIPQAEYGIPRLTTVRQPLAYMGRVGIQMLLRRINEPDIPTEQLVVSTELIVRDSCRPIFPDD
ncbi:MAG: LacI family DNA-binding transcriptional regulator [Anaerolineales bacterium]|nr:LacI family DNA-binding transcriptional regulator [Anaerolineales bacterium]